MQEYPLSAELKGMGVLYRESFRSKISSQRNGLSLVNNPTFVNGMVLNGTTQYALANWQFSGHDLWFKFVFTPDFAAADGLAHTLVSYGTAFTTNSILLVKHNVGNSNNLICYFGTGYVYASPANYSPYWLQGQENTLIVSVGSIRRMWLNGNSLTVSAVDGGTGHIPQLYICCYVPGGGYYYYFDGTIHDIMVGAGRITDEDAAVLYTDDLLHLLQSERSLITLPTAQPKLEADGVELVQDADCRAITAGAWVKNNNAVLSKVYDAAVGQYVMRIAYGGTPSPSAYQNIMTVGTPYRVRGRARSDGVNEPRLYVATNGQIWVGTTSTDWQYFDFVFTPLHAWFFLYSAAISGYVEFLDVSVQRVRTIIPAEGLFTRRELGAEILADGDMEATGTAGWTPVNGAIPTKATSALGYPSTQCLRIACSGLANPYAQEATVLTAGRLYRCTGYARSDGIAVPKVYWGGVVKWTGSNSTDWQYFEVQVVAASSAAFALLTLTAVVGEYAEFDMVSFKEVVRTGAAVLSGTDGLTVAQMPTLRNENSLYFDGGDTVAIPSNGDFTEGGLVDKPVTVAVLARFGDIIYDFEVANTSRGAASSGFWVGTTGVGSRVLFMRWLDAAGNFIQKYWSTNLDSYVGRMVHMAWTYDGSKVIGGMACYMNGVRVDDTNAVGGVYSGLSVNYNDIWVGHATSYMNGTIRMLRIDGRALSPLQIKALCARAYAEVNI